MKMKFKVGVKFLYPGQKVPHTWTLELETWKQMKNSTTAHIRENVASYKWYTVSCTIPLYFGSKQIKGVVTDAETTASR